MRIQVKVVVLLATASVLACVVSTCRTTQPATSQPSRVSLYVRGLTPGFVSFDTKSRRLEALGPDLTTRPGYWGYLDSRVDERDCAALQKLLESLNLKRFIPDIRWFGRTRINLEGSAAIVLVWPDKELDVVMPPDDVRTNLPSAAVMAYDRLDRLGTLMLRLKKKQAHRSRIVEVSFTDSQFAHFKQRRDDVFAQALPRGRKGW